MQSGRGRTEGWRRLVVGLRARWAYVLALTPVLTDWLDAGHLPAHPREWVSELVLGGVLATCVWLLYRDAHRLRGLAETDVLTGLRNRRKFREDLAAEVTRAERLGVPLSLAIIDVDRFKSINDRFGHNTGDRVLQVVGAGFGGLRNELDQGYRIGGDEFAALLVGTHADDALSALTRAFQDGWRERAWDIPPVIVSVGVVERAMHEGDDAFVARADRLMYAAKSGQPSAAGVAPSFGRVALGADGGAPPNSESCHPPPRAADGPIPRSALVPAAR